MSRALTDRVRGRAFVTGGASGIGAALCRTLGRAGVPVCVVDVDELGARAVAQELNDAGHDARAMVLDVSNRQAFVDAIDEAEADGVPVDLLINNAGVGLGGEIRDNTADDWHRILSVNLYGVVHGVDAVYSRMLDRGRGSIVNIASLAGLVAVPGEGPYVASKHAVVGLTKVLAAEAAALGVDVLLVCPGVVRTPIYESSPTRGFDADKILSMWPKGITAEQCAARIVRGIAARERQIVVTRSAKAMWWLERLSPRLMARFGRVYMERARQHRVD
ncbi:MAG: SDR family NAD(P)-dependent oxidoreductase [Myxococcota bacterium]